MEDFFMKLGKISKRMIAVACVVALIIAGFVYVPSTTKAAAKTWTKLNNKNDGGNAVITDTSTEDYWGVKFVGLTTDYSWDADSIWQYFAEVTNVPITSGEINRLSLTVTTDKPKVIQVRIECGADSRIEKPTVNGTQTLQYDFDAGAEKCNINVAFGATSSAEVGTYDVEISNMTVTDTGETGTTKPGKACTLGAWSYADAPGTSGWQYWINDAAYGSRYEGGTSLSDSLVIDYGAYVEAADTCQARSPMIDVEDGKTYTGTFTITNSSQYNMENIEPAVVAYVDGSYQWYAASTEGKQTVPAGGSYTWNFTYVGPSCGKIVYAAATHYTPPVPITFAATHNGDAPTTTAGPTTTASPTTTATPTTTEAPSDTTAAPTETAKPGPGPQTTAKPVPKTTAAPKPAKPAKAKVKKATKKKSAKKIKVTLKKIKGATKYQVKVSKKKNGKALYKKTVKKVKFTLKSKKFKKKKKLYIKARAWNTSGYGAWSKAKKVKIKK